MKPEDTFLFLATHQRLSDDQRHQLEEMAAKNPLRWDIIFRTAEQNGVAPLIYHNIMQLPSVAAQVPQRLLDFYKLYSMKNALAKKERARSLNQALHFLHERNISVIVIKGASLDLLVYDQPWYTEYSDTDLILGTRRAFLSDHQQQEIDDYFYKKQVEYDFFEHHDFTINGMLPIDFDAVWKSARPVMFGDAEAMVLSPEDQLISICANSCRKRFFRLKSLLDICETIEKCHELDWDLLIHRCQSFSCGNIVYAALYVAATVMNLHLPNNLLNTLETSPVRRAMIRLNVQFLLKFWTLSRMEQRLRLFNRAIDFRLILPYAAYTPRQTFHKFLEIREAKRNAWTKN